jgi:flagellar hook-associated protein 2
MASSGVVSVAGGVAAAAGGSVINVSTLVSQLVQATRGPRDQVITQESSAVTTKISALSTLKSALSTFESSLSTLNTPSAFSAVTASSSNSAQFSASATSDAPPGHYSVSITSLASAQQLLSTAFAGGSTATVGTGTLSISLGATSFSLDVDATNNTVAGLAAAINSATDNPGIAAAVVQGTDGAHLLLSSTVTGAANTIQISESDAGTGLAGITYGTGNTANYAQNAAASDASLSVAGVAFTSSTNTVTGAISGVTLDLTGTTPSGTPATLSIADDTGIVAANINSFVSAYNTLRSSIAPLGAYDKTTSSAGSMLGDPLLSGIQNEIRHTLQSVVGTGAYSTLASIGITTQKDGTLQADAGKIQNVLGTNFPAVRELFSGQNGIASRLDTQVKAALATGGSIDSRSKSLIKQNDHIDAETASLNKEMDALTTSLTQQYTALNVLLSQLQTTSGYLTQAINSLPSVQNKSNG